MMMPFLYLFHPYCSPSRPPKELAALTVSHFKTFSSHPPTFLGWFELLARPQESGRKNLYRQRVHALVWAQRAFEVVNHPARIRRSSANELAYPNTDIYQRVPVAPKSLGDVDWLDRRRSLNAAVSIDSF
ncbi:hypothetical protein BDR05DRAFT_556239 [Suillus weaverae]|nr:hypothetical protein BDR05DRAFT_556239 [Suillus weaverae]